MGWVKGSDRNFEASQTERYRKTKKDRRERRETSGGDPKIRVRGRGSSITNGVCGQLPLPGSYSFPASSDSTLVLKEQPSAPALTGSVQGPEV